MNAHKSLSAFLASMPAASRHISFNMTLYFDLQLEDLDAQRAFSEKLKEYDIYAPIYASDRRVDIKKVLSRDVINNLIRDLSLILRPLKLWDESQLTLNNLAWYIKGPALNTQTVFNLKKQDLLFKYCRGSHNGEAEDEFWLGSEHEIFEIKKTWLQQHPRRSVVVKPACPFGSPLKVNGNTFHVLLKEGLELSLRDALESAPASYSPKIKI